MEYDLHNYLLMNKPESSNNIIPVYSLSSSLLSLLLPLSVLPKSLKTHYLDTVLNSIYQNEFVNWDWPDRNSLCATVGKNKSLTH